MNTTSRTKLLVIASLLFLSATGYIVATYGQSVYFVTFHKPFHVSLAHSSTKYTPPILPKFQVQPTISSRSLARGGIQHITITVSPDKAVAGYLEVWIESPGHKQVFQSSTNGVPVRFSQDKTRAFTYDYTLPKDLPSGTYSASAIITSVNQQTDYYVNINFATFTVS